MPEFFKQLQEFILKDQKEHLPTLVPYYETLYQHRDKLSEMLNEVNNFDSIGFEYQYDEEEYYTEGAIHLRFYKEDNDERPWDIQPDYHFEIELLYDERYWGYCDCNPEDEGYDSNKKCCGNGCDWVAPQISVKKVSDLVFESFDGVERDMWELERKWNESLEEHNERVRQEQIERLENNIKEFQEEVSRLKAQ
ncbi:hypothetical protein [Halobacillus litoralis]|uniref:hypothetical protein n=1 Tax=Halobacillus litoralis TaxID=45668 RepID=UPI001CD6DD32|nr:hypothetical protein [Halobacillus litoralis]MCA1021509.1 hypothetical protein [Halobacillus litoralis]